MAVATPSSGYTVATSCPRMGEKLPRTTSKNPAVQRTAGCVKAKMPPTGLQQQAQTPGKTHVSDLVVPPVVPLAAKVDFTPDEIELLNAYRRLSGNQKKQTLQMLWDIQRQKTP